MKNLTVYKTKEEILNFCSSLWATTEFKESFKKQEYIGKLCDLFASRPRIVIEMTDSSLEHPHFYSWLNILSKRVYNNPYIQDLYYLHEIYHMATMTYDPNLNYTKWADKMIENELMASLNSEVLVYKHLPIREKSFSFPIWFDSLVEDDFKDTAALAQKRVFAMNNPKNKVEDQLSSYREGNELWVEIWRDAYPEVEGRVKSLIETGDVESFLLWIKKNTDQEIPFFMQAKVFSSFYHKKLKQGIV